MLTAFVLLSHLNVYKAKMIWYRYHGIHICQNVAGNLKKRKHIVFLISIYYLLSFVFLLIITSSYAKIKYTILFLLYGSVHISGWIPTINLQKQLLLTEMIEPNCWG
uniref:Uncharacterized protein n=1 Tax=Micrurus spixii TaxID=129469 RepID=A0A2D4MUU4_9SAUR